MKAGIEQRSTNSEIIGMELVMPPLTPNILVVDDDKAILKLVSKILARNNNRCDGALSIGDARALMEKNRYDIVFLDLMLPDGSGISLLEECLTVNSSTMVVIITGEQELASAIQVIRKGACDFISKPFNLAVFEERSTKVIEEWRSQMRCQYYRIHLEGLVDTAMEKLRRTNEQIEQIYDMTVSALGAALDLRDPETEDHCRRVSENSVRLGSALGLSKMELRNLKWGAYLHDIGKIGIPEHVLSKTSHLSPKEMDLVKVHPVLGAKMISNIDFLRDATDVVLFHHEKYDGSGYPYGSKGNDIPLAARIFTVIDAMDAMVYDRPYRKALSFSDFVDELKRESTKQFDPNIVNKFLEVPESAWLVEENSKKVELSERIVDAQCYKNRQGGESFGRPEESD